MRNMRQIDRFDDQIETFEMLTLNTLSDPSCIDAFCLRIQDCFSGSSHQLVSVSLIAGVEVCEGSGVN